MFKLERFELLCFNSPVDMRKSFRGLLLIVEREMKEDGFSEKAFLFFNKRRNYLKLIFWDRTGYCLICKKLEQGSFFLPEGDLVQELDLKRLRLIFDGIKLGKEVKKR